MERYYIRTFSLGGVATGPAQGKATEWTRWVEVSRRDFATAERLANFHSGRPGVLATRGFSTPTVEGKIEMDQGGDDG